MEKIIHHIETLLRRHDYVIIPDFGGFVLQNQSSVITPESIQPPLAVISFNPLMKTSDGLLAIELSRAEQISFRQAVQIINREVASARSLLEKGKQFELGNLGILKADGVEKIIFIPTSNSHFIPSNFGLSTLHITPISKISEEEKHIIQIVLPPRKTIVKYAAVAAVVTGLFFGAPKINDAYHNFANLSPVSLFDKSESDVETPKAKPVQAQFSAVKESLAAEHGEASNHVIVSCMANQKEADEYCARLKSLNYQNASVLPSKRTFKVAIDSFMTNEEAVNYLYNLRKTKPQFAAAWILSE